MIGYAVYIISMDGTPLVSEKFQAAESIPNESLLAGLLTAVQGVASELVSKDSQIASMNIDNLSYHFKSFGRYQIVLVTDLIETPKAVLQKLGLLFMKEHGEELLDQTIDTQVFESFTHTIRDVISSVLLTDTSRKIIPTRKFGPGELYNFPEDLRSIALALIALREGSLNDIAHESQKSKKIAQKSLQTLQEMGFVGKKISGKDSIYFCSI